ncbi:MAG: GAP family protein [Actinomycetes bacterium]
MLAEVAPFAVATALSPLPLVVLLVVLVTPRAVPNGFAFAAGWAGALVLVGGLTLSLAGSRAGLDEGSLGVAALEVVVGLAVLMLAGRQWARRLPVGSPPAVPGWLQVADTWRSGRAFGMGALLVVANPKNLALAIAAAGAVATTSAGSSREQTQGLAAFAILGSVGVGVPLAIRLAMGSRANRWLGRWRAVLVTHGATVAAAVLGVLGAALLARGVLGRA